MAHLDAEFKRLQENYLHPYTGIWDLLVVNEDSMLEPVWDMDKLHDFTRWADEVLAELESLEGGDSQ